MASCRDRPEPGRRLTIVSQVFPPDFTATSQLLDGLAQGLAGQGLAVTVLCGFPTQDGMARAEIPRRESRGGVAVERCGWNVPSKRSYGHRAVAYASFLLHAGWRLLWRRGGRTLGVSNPPFVAWLLAVVSLVTRRRYEYLCHDVYPDGLVALGLVREGGMVARLWRLANRICYQRAATCYVVGRDMADLLGRRYGMTRDRIVFLPSWSPLEWPQPPAAEANPLTQRLGLGGRFVVQYSGNMGLWHDMRSLVEAAARCRDDHRIRFLFSGGGVRRSQAENLARELGADNIVWVDLAPPDELDGVLLAGDVALISLRAGLAGVAVPSKLYGSLAAARPIVAQVPSDSEVALVLEEEGCGLVVAPGNVDELVAAIRRLADDERLRNEMGRRAFAAYHSKYTLARAVAQVSCSS